MKFDKAFAAEVFNEPVHFLAFGFGTGLSPFAPGTVGTLAGVLFYYLIADFNVASYLVVLILGTIAGIGLCEQSSRMLGVHDHSGIVWDEIIGYLVTMMFAPFGWQWMLLGFIYFRFFDIVKPYPIGWLDKQVDGGLGIMLDDLVAGIFAAMTLHLTIWLF